MFIILEANFFQLCFLYKRELRISTVKQGIIKLKRFKTRSTTIPYTFLMGYRYQGYSCELHIAFFAWRMS